MSCDEACCVIASGFAWNTSIFECHVAAVAAKSLPGEFHSSFVWTSFESFNATNCSIPRLCGLRASASTRGIDDIVNSMTVLWLFSKNSPRHTYNSSAFVRFARICAFWSSRAYLPYAILRNLQDKSLLISAPIGERGLLNKSCCIQVSRTPVALFFA